MKNIKQLLVKLFTTQRKYFEENGERIFIDSNQIDFNKFDMYQKNHFRRYEFAENIISSDDIVGDFACGTGYGTILLANKAKKVIGIDINAKIVREIKKKYNTTKNAEFLQSNLLDIKYSNIFDKIISFETVEHLDPENIPALFKSFSSALKPKGMLIFSVPYKQDDSEIALKMGHHKTFHIDEDKISIWLGLSSFELETIYYQNYKSHEIVPSLSEKDFIICICRNTKI